MINSIWSDVNRSFTAGSAVTRLIIVNVAVFVLINLIKIFMGGNGDHFRDFLFVFCLSGDVMENVTGPWRIVTSIFLHEDFWHLLWNMLVFYWFGRVVGDLLGDRRIWPLYLLGGIAGELAFILANALDLMQGGYLLGASAGIMAILMVAGMKAPDYRFHLLLIGEVKLKYIVIAVFFLDLVSIANYSNTGGHIAHIGGFLFGGLYVYLLHTGVDLAEPINRLTDFGMAFFKRIASSEKNRKRPEKVFTNAGSFKKGRQQQRRPPANDSVHQERIDAILDKIKQSGYNSLTQEEKEFLFKASNQ